MAHLPGTNLGGASAAEIETLGETVRARVRAVCARRSSRTPRAGGRPRPHADQFGLHDDCGRCPIAVAAGTVVFRSEVAR